MLFGKQVVEYLIRTSASAYTLHQSTKQRNSCLQTRIHFVTKKQTTEM